MKCKPPLVAVFISAALAATGCSQASERLGQPPLATSSVTDQILAADVDAYLENHVKEGFSGSALVSKGDEVLLHGGYGELGATTMEADSRYWIASMTKQFTAASILALRDRRRISLTDQLHRFFPDAPADKSNITLLQLLTHRSGLPQDYIADGITDRSIAVRAILGQPLKHPPGERFSYSNDNYQLAAAIIEIISGRQFEDFVASTLLEPAGLSATGFWGGERAQEVVPLPSAVSVSPGVRHWGQLGSGGMFSTVADLHRWYVVLRNGTVLSQSSVQELFKPHVPSSRVGVGLGWFTSPTGRGSTSIWTRGNESFGPNGLLYGYPEEGSIVVLLSHAGESPDGTPWTRQLHAGVEARLLGPKIAE